VCYTKKTEKLIRVIYEKGNTKAKEKDVSKTKEMVGCH